MFKLEDWLKPEAVNKYGDLLRNTLRNMDESTWDNTLYAFHLVQGIVDDEIDRRIGSGNRSVLR